MRLRSIRPGQTSSAELPNDNTPAEAAPGTVGPPSAVPGDPHGLTIEGQAGGGLPPRIVPSAWSGWPDGWAPPYWGTDLEGLTDTAWLCLDLNSSLLATMPPYLVGAAPSIDASWTINPDPDIYTSWEDFAKQLFWDYQMGEAFVLPTARYATGYPARFHVVPPWMVAVDYGPGVGERTYMMGALDVTDQILHIRYKATVHDLHGHGPLEIGAARLVADQMLIGYAQGFISSGAVPVSILSHPEKLTGAQATQLQTDWVAARQSTMGEPAVLSGGVTHESAVRRISPKDMALIDLQHLTESRIAVLLGVPPYLAGLPSGADPSLVYTNASGLFDYHWRAGLRPKAQAVMAALSQWALPRGAAIELNRDAYVEADPYQRAQTYQILYTIGALSIDEIRAAERFQTAGAAGLPTPEVTSVE
jgi:HK97 family phage portal protein